MKICTIVFYIILVFNLTENGKGDKGVALEHDMLTTQRGYRAFQLLGRQSTDAVNEHLEAQ